MPQQAAKSKLEARPAAQSGIPPVSDQKPRIHPWTLGVILAVMMGGVIVGISYMQRNKYEATSPRPAYITKIERDIEATTQDGTAFRLSSMKEKVYLAFLCSAPPVGESADKSALDPLPALVREATKDFAQRPDFGVILFSATPSEDTPERMKGYLAQHGIADAGWNFLTAAPDTLIPYLLRYLRLYPVMPALPGTDPKAIPTTGPRHDTRVVLIDRKANIRGYYRLLDPKDGAAYATALRQHLAYVLDNP
jgi:cytochrome oxidase Cu insertion factor (SCO1/SenC/PrrC family)